MIQRDNICNNCPNTAWDCFKSTIGFDVAIALIESTYGLYAVEVAAGWAVDSTAAAAFRKAGIQAAKEVIKKYLGFIGAAVVIGEFIWCLTS